MIVAGATLADLVLAVKARTAAVLAVFWGLSNRSGDLQPPQVHIGDLPPKDSRDANRFPWAVVRLRDHTDSEESGNPTAAASVEIELGTYRDEPDGILDLYHLIEALRMSLIQSPILDGTAFYHVGPLASAIPDLQPRPEWLGAVSTIWRIPRPERAVEV